MQTVQAQFIALSVVIPCYNQGDYLLEALSSVKTCLEPVYEVIIVNDGSNDPLTISLFSDLKEQGYCILDQENQGLASARNNGIIKASGRYILPLDADNKIRADYILKGIEILDQNPEVGVVYGQPNWFGEVVRSWELPDKFDVNRLIRGNYIDACAVYRKSVWQNCGGYDANMPVPGWEDWDLWLSAIEQGWQFHYIPEVLFDYRVRQNSMAAQCDIPENRSQLMKYLCTKHFDLYQTNFTQMISERELHIGNLELHIVNLEGYCKNLLQRGEDLEKMLEHSRSELQKTQVELVKTQMELVLTQQRNIAMESSKFWKLRRAWFQLRHFLGLRGA